MSKNKNKKGISAGDWLIIVGVIFIIILSVGLFFWQKEKEKERKFIELEKKKSRLIIVNGQIVELENKKETLEQIESSAFIAGRALIGFLLVILNCLYKYYFIYPFEFGKLLDFNGAILLCYSFIAFISYGTPTNFAKNIKKKISDSLKSRHIVSLAELEQLINEREALITEIHILEEIKLFDGSNNN